MNRVILQLAGIEANLAQYPTTLRKSEALHPLAILHKEQHPPAREILNQLNRLPLDAAMPFVWREVAEERAEALPVGYFRFPDKTGYVHIKAAADGVTAKMLDWLDTWVGGEAIRYKILYPGFHAHIEPAGPNALRCITALRADLDGKGTEPLSFVVKREPGAGARRAGITAGPFKAAAVSVVLTRGELHGFIWLGNGLNPMMRGYFDEKRLYDIARYGAHVAAQTGGVLPGLYEMFR